MKQKLFIFITLVIILALLILGLLFNPQKTTPSPSRPSPTPTLVQTTPLPLLITPVPGESKSITFQIHLPPKSFPQALPLYRVSRLLSLQKMNAVAQNLGFLNKPTVTKGLGSTIYSWQKGGSVLSYRENPPSLTLSDSVPLGVAPGQATATDAVKLFITTAGLDSNLDLSATSATYYTIKGLNLVEATSPQEANLISLSFRYAGGGYPIYQEASSTQDITANVGRAGKISSVFIASPLSLSRLTDTTLMGAEGASLSLRDGRGVLVNTTALGYKEASFVDTFSLVEISDISLAYVLETNSTIAKPVYVFGGSAFNSKNEEVAKVTYFVNAGT